MTETECPLSELPPAQCACPKHRGGTAPGEEAIETAGQMFDAIFGGRCEGDCSGIRVGDPIIRAADGGYVHAGQCPR